MYIKTIETIILRQNDIKILDEVDFLLNSIYNQVTTEDIREIVENIKNDLLNLNDYVEEEE